MSGDLDEVKNILDEKKSNRRPDDYWYIVNGKEKKYYYVPDTPLHYACQEGHLKVVKYLVEQGADVNSIASTGWWFDSGMTPLHMACNGGALNVVKYLVDERRVKVNVKDYYGNTPLHYALKKRRFFFYWFYKYKNIDDLYHIGKYLIDKGANTNATNNNGEKPLDYYRGKDLLDL